MISLPEWLYARDHTAEKISVVTYLDIYIYFFYQRDTYMGGIMVFTRQANQLRKTPMCKFMKNT